MHALPPPAPVQCVSAENARNAWGYVVLSGAPAQLDAAIADFGPSWLVDAKAVNNGVAFARLKHSADIKYRDIGALIIDAQRRGLAVTVFTDPPICGLFDQ